MLPKKKIEGLTEYWIKNSKEKLKTMIGKSIPKTHNLRYLAELTGLDFEPEEVKLIAKANEFNMEARYPNEKMEFYKLCTKKYTDQFYEPIISLHKKLCQKAK